MCLLLVVPRVVVAVGCAVEGEVRGATPLLRGVGVCGGKQLQWLAMNYQLNTNKKKLSNRYGILLLVIARSRALSRSG